MGEFLLSMAIPMLLPAALLYVFGIMRFSLQKKLKKAFLFIVAASLLGYVAAEPAVYFLKPWSFDCSKTLGICLGGLPIEDLLVSFMVTFNVTMAAIVFSEMERRSRTTGEFLDYFFLFKDLRLKLAKKKN